MMRPQDRIRKLPRKNIRVEVNTAPAEPGGRWGGVQGQGRGPHGVPCRTGPVSTERAGGDPVRGGHDLIGKAERGGMRPHGPGLLQPNWSRCPGSGAGSGAAEHRQHPAQDVR